MRCFLSAVAGVLAIIPVHAGTVGTLVPVRGQLADLAFDQHRGVVYAANFTAGRVEVVSDAGQALGKPFTVANGPSALALSPDGRFLVVGHYFGAPTTVGAVTVLDLDAQQQRVINTPPVVAVAFGGGNLALICTTAGFRTLDPFTGEITALPLSAAPTGGTLPVAPGTFPPNIIRASTGVSGDGQVVYVLTEAGSPASNYLFIYSVAQQQVVGLTIGTSPPLGPRAVSVDANGLNVLAGWGLIRMYPAFHLLAQIPNQAGSYNLGSHAFDYARNLIYAQATSGTAAGSYPIEAPVLHVMDTDNLTVRERLKLTQWLSGKSIFSPDMQSLFSISDSGLLIFRIDPMLTAPRVVPAQEALFFDGNSCDNSLITKTLQIVDPNSGHTDFTLSLPTGTRGIRISPAGGVTPATVTIEVDPITYRGTQGTVTIPLAIESAAAVNINQPVRLLISTRDFDQKGRIVQLAGKITDLLSDPVRNRFYVLRQDKNVVQAFDATSLQQIGEMRTGNTPVQMAITPDAAWMLVGNENSQIANVFDLEAMAPSHPILFPFGQYPHSIAASGGVILATARASGGPNMVHLISFDQRIANPIGNPNTPGPLPDIYQNNISGDSILFASPFQGTIMLAQPDGSVLLFETSSQKWVAARKDFASLSGAYASLDDNTYIVGNSVFDQAMVPKGSFGLNTTNISVGAAVSSGGVLRTAPISSGVAVIERLDRATLSLGRSARLAENPPPVMTTGSSSPLVGLIGQYSMPFSRSLAVVPTTGAYISLSTSGLMVIPGNFDQPVPIPSIESVRNIADFTTGIAPGSLISVVGNGLTISSDAATGPPWPTSLASACITYNNAAIPLSSAGPNEIRAQLPYGAVGGSLLVKNAAGTSAAFALTVLQGAPAVFRDGTAGPETGIPSIIRAKNNELLTVSNPLHPNDPFSIFLTGAGNVTPPVPAGYGAPGNPLSQAISTPLVTLGDLNLTVTFAGLVPGQVGVYRIDAQTPDKVTPGWTVPLTITQGSYSTTLSVRVLEK